MELILYFLGILSIYKSVNYNLATRIVCSIRSILTLYFFRTKARASIVLYFNCNALCSSIAGIHYRKFLFSELVTHIFRSLRSENQSLVFAVSHSWDDFE